MDAFYHIFETTPDEADKETIDLFLFAMKHIYPAINTKWKKKNYLGNLKSFKEIDNNTEAFAAILAKYWTIPKWPRKGGPPATLADEDEEDPPSPSGSHSRNEDREGQEPAKKKMKRDITGESKKQCVLDYINLACKIGERKQLPGARERYEAWDSFLATNLELGNDSQYQLVEFFDLAEEGENDAPNNSNTEENSARAGLKRVLPDWGRLNAFLDTAEL